MNFNQSSGTVNIDNSTWRSKTESICYSFTKNVEQKKSFSPLNILKHARATRANEIIVVEKLGVCALLGVNSNWCCFLRSFTKPTETHVGWKLRQAQGRRIIGRRKRRLDVRLYYLSHCKKSKIWWLVRISTVF